MRAALVRVGRVVVTVCCCPASLAGWVRGGYPLWSTRPGHVALVALCGQDGSPIEHKPRSATSTN
jgi:hypothetical protein